MFYIVGTGTEQILETIEGDPPDVQRWADYLGCAVYVICGEHSGLSAEPAKKEVVTQIGLSGAIEEGGDGESNDGSLAFEDGVPCDHPGCASHIKHPCEMCGRTGARGKITLGRVWHQFPEVEDADTN